MFPLNYSHFYVQNQIFAWRIMRFQKKIYLNPTNGSKVMQDYRNHAPSGIVSLFGRGGGPFRIELSFFGIFNMYRLSFQKNALKKFSTKFSLYDGLAFA